MSTNEDVQNGIVDRIRHVMSFQKVSIKALADRVDVPYRTLQDYLRGKHGLPAGVLARICKELDVSADWLLFGVGHEFDLVIVANLLSVIEDVRFLGSRKQPFDACAQLFMNMYNKDYPQRFRTEGPQ